MKTKSISKKLEEFNKKIDRLRKAWTKEAETLFKEAVAEVFASEPNLESFSWTQYTPYFMDGDTCVFGVNDLCAINDVSCNDYEEEEEGEEKTVDIAAPKLEKIKDALTHIIYGIPGEYMQDVFGDHMKITVHRTGKIEKEEYEHE